MGAEWVCMLNDMICSRIKSEFSDALKKKYKMTDIENFSTELSKNTKAKFPFVLIQMLPAYEVGQDIEGTSFNAGMFTFQIDVTDNKSQSRANEVAFEILRIMKEKGFQVVSIPNFEYTKDVNRCTARYKRLIGSGDTI